MKYIVKILIIGLLFWSNNIAFSQYSPADIQITDVSPDPFVIRECENSSATIRVLNGSFSNITTGQVMVHVTISGELSLPPQIIVGYVLQDGNGNLFEVTYIDYINGNTEVILHNTQGNLLPFATYDIQLPFVGLVSSLNKAVIGANISYIDNANFYDPEMGNNGANGEVEVLTKPSYIFTFNGTPMVNNDTKEVCQGAPITLNLSGTPGSTYVLKQNGNIIGGGNVVGSDYDFTAGLTDNGSYELTITSQYGCIQIFNYELIVNPLPACSITGSTAPICPGTTLGFSAPAGMTSYQWSITGNGTITGASNSANVQVTAGSACGQSYTLTLVIIDGETCTTTCSVVVMVEDTQAPLISGSLTDINISGCTAGDIPAAVTTVAALEAFGVNISDNCTTDGALTVSSTDGTHNTSCGISFVRTYTIRDACLNTSVSLSQNITIIQTLPPTQIGGPVVTSSSVECVSEINGVFTLPTVESACGTILIPTGPIVTNINPSLGNDFTSAVTLSATEAAGVWYTDRYAPAGFTSPVTFLGNARLKQSISSADGANNRPPAFSSSFYDTQGRKFNLQTGSTYAEIELYVPSQWETTGRRMAGFWATSQNIGNVDAGFPIIEFISNGTSGNFRVWESGSGSWVNIGLPSGFAYDSWVKLSIQLLPGSEYLIRAGSLSYMTISNASALAVRLDNVILQGHNNATGVTYDIHWDNFRYNNGSETVDCGGQRNYTYHYVDCAGLTYDWTYSYEIEHTTPPAEEGTPVLAASSVECLADALAPAVLPVVKDVCGAILIPSGPVVTDINPLLGNDFSAAITLAPTASNGVWYVDRYAPAAFVSATGFNGDTRLLHSISSSNAQANQFNNTQGRGYNLASNSTYLEIEMYIPAAWENSGKRMAGLWSTAFNAGNAASGFPIVEFSSDNSDPRFRVYETGSGAWIDLGLPAGFAYDTWTKVSIKVLPDNSFLYTAGNLSYITQTGLASGSVRLNNVILQGYNTTAGVTYDIYWDNLQYNDGSETLECGGEKRYTYHYSDCAGLTYDWTYIYTIERTTPPMEVGGPVVSSQTVQCSDDAVVPVSLPIVQDVCGNTLTPSGPIITNQNSSFGNDFSSPVTLSPTAANGVWYVDRFAPSAFISATSFNGDTRLLHSINGADARPDNFSNTQGRAYNLDANSTYTEIEMFIPSGWATTGRRMAGFWSTAFDNSNAVSAYPIVEFTSEGSARFRVWESGSGTWVDLGLPSGFIYDSWVKLSITQLPGGEFLLQAGSLSYITQTSAGDGSVRLGTAILQGHNTTTGVTYDIYWDNFNYNSNNETLQCGGEQRYTYHYADCAGLTYDWTYTYTIDVPAPVITSCPVDQVNCINLTETYTIPVITATQLCNNTLNISYNVTGATSRSGTGSDASGNFNVGTSTINWTVDDGCQQVTCMTAVVINPLPTATIAYTQPEFCATGTAMVTQTGQAGGTYTSTPAGLIIDNTTGALTLTGSTPGDYTVTYGFTNPLTMCSGTTSTLVTVWAQPIISIVSIDSVDCKDGMDGAAVVLGTGGTGTLDYMWDFGDITPDVMGLAAGTYTVIVTDENGCNASTSVVVSEPNELKIVSYIITNETCTMCGNGSITINATGGTLNYQYSIDNGNTWHTSNYFSSLSAGSYQVVVRDARGCQTLTDVVTITVPGVYADLTPQHFLSSSILNLNQTANAVVKVRNIGNGPTVGTYTFTVSKFSTSSGVTLDLSNDAVITITGDNYPLSHDKFDIVSLPGFYVFTSNSSAPVIPLNGSINVGFVIKRIGGTPGQFNLTSTVAGGSGGEINQLNNFGVSTLGKN